MVEESALGQPVPALTDENLAKAVSKFTTTVRTYHQIKYLRKPRQGRTLNELASTTCAEHWSDVNEVINEEIANFFGNHHVSQVPLFRFASLTKPVATRGQGEDCHSVTQRSRKRKRSSDTPSTGFTASAMASGVPARTLSRGLKIDFAALSKKSNPKPD